MLSRRKHVSTALAGAALARSNSYAVRLGGPAFTKSDDPVELAREHKRLGYTAAYCPKATVEDGDRVRAIMKAFAAENVVISEVGAWVNMLDPDLEKRRKNME